MTIKNALLQAAVIAATLLAPVARADINFSLNPTTQTVNVGGTFSYDLLVSGLTSGVSALGGYDITIGYAPAIVAPSLIAYTNRLGNPPFEAMQMNSFFAGTLEIVEVSLLSPAALLSRQTFAGSSFSLATLTFDALAAGTSSLTLAVAASGTVDQDGYLLNATTTDGQAIVTQSVSGVPEPSAIWLLVTAAGGVLALRRRKARK